MTVCTTTLLLSEKQMCRSTYSHVPIQKATIYKYTKVKSRLKG